MKSQHVAFALALCFSLGIPASIAQALQSFSDVLPANSFYEPVEALKAQGIIQGYSDGTFKPDAKVNRAESLKMVVKSANIPIEKGFFATGYSDVSLDSWYAGYVWVGTLNGIVKGNPDGTFAPVRNVNKAEFIKMATKAAGTDLSGFQNGATDVAADVKAADWFAPSMAYAKLMGIATPTLQNELFPGKELSRGECADILYKMYLLKNGGETQKMLNITESKLVDAIVQSNAGNLKNAIADANDATFYSGIALNASPSSTVAQAANKIAQGFQKLFLAYEAANQNDETQKQTLLTQAKTFASDAAQTDSSTKDLADKLTALADAL